MNKRKKRGPPGGPLFFPLLDSLLTSCWHLFHLSLPDNHLARSRPQRAQRKDPIVNNLKKLTLGGQAAAFSNPPIKSPHLLYKREARGDFAGECGHTTSTFFARSRLPLILDSGRLFGNFLCSLCGSEREICLRFGCFLFHLAFRIPKSAIPTLRGFSLDTRLIFSI